MMLNPRVVTVAPLKGHKLKLVFADGQTRVFDTTPYLNFPCYQALKNESVFVQVRASHGTVEWPGGLDWDPDTLFLESHTFS